MFVGLLYCCPLIKVDYMIFVISAAGLKRIHDII